MISYDLGLIQVDIDFSKMTPREYWDDRHEMFERIRSSVDFYESLSYDERIAINNKVRHALAIMHDNVESWIPDAFNLDDAGNRIKIELNLMVADIDKDIEDSQLATSFQLADAAEKLKKIIEEVSEEED